MSVSWMAAKEATKAGEIVLAAGLDRFTRYSRLLFPDRPKWPSAVSTSSPEPFRCAGGLTDAK